MLHLQRLAIQIRIALVPLAATIITEQYNLATIRKSIDAINNPTYAQVVRLADLQGLSQGEYINGDGEDQRHQSKATI